jgi:hypothetical protein
MSLVGNGIYQLRKQITGHLCRTEPNLPVDYQYFAVFYKGYNGIRPIP